MHFFHHFRFCCGTPVDSIISLLFIVVLIALLIRAVQK